MVDRIGPQAGQNLEGFRPLRPQAPAPTPPAPQTPSPLAPTINGDVNFARGNGAQTAFDLPDLPFEQGGAGTQATDALTLRDWRNVVLATHQAGMGGLLDSLARDLGSHSPGAQESLPLAVDQRTSQNRATARWTLGVAQRTGELGYQESTRHLALLAGETATDRPSAIAAFKLADRLGGHTEAEHILFRTTQRAQNDGDALATARRALSAGYPDAAKYAYYRAATLSPTAEGALAAAREASHRGLAFESDEAGFEAWKQRLDQQFVKLEGPTVGPDAAGSLSPYRQLPLAKARYTNPYLAAMLKADRADFPRVAAAAADAGELETAALIASRARIGQPPG